MLTIYGAPTYNATKVVLTAEEASLEYDYVSFNLGEGEQKSPEHLKRHALGKVPAIDHEGKSLFESGAICRYLAQVSNSSLYGGDTYQKAEIDQWVDMMSSHVGRWLGTLFFQEFIIPKIMQGEANLEAIAEAKGFLEQQLPAIDTQLGNSKYLANNTVTIADTIAFSYFQIRDLTSVDLSSYSNINAWYDDFNKRESVRIANELVNGL